MDSILNILSSEPFFYVALVAGIALLVYAGDWVVESSTRVAEYFNVSKLIIGVTIVSMGTSLPELCVSLSAALDGSANIAIGNVVGSNIANVCLILGITAIIITLPISRSVIRRDLMILLAATLLFAFSLIDSEINLLEGIFLLLLMVLYMYITFKSAKKEAQQSEPDEENVPKKKHNIWISLLLVIISCAGLIAGSELLVYGAENIARSLGVSDRVIAVTVVAIGTSLPELTTSIVAAIKKELDISVGNIIGSNIFNICMIIGLTSCVTPLEAEANILSFDVWFLLASLLLLGITVFPIKGRTEIVRIEGIMLLLLYIGYYVAMGLTGQFAALG
ncbi:MAG: calcium/sodium antiporter [Bacteroidales bacterium]|nr:calcium/sodium antiporter [Bacteroidales bacterium]